MLTQKPLFTGRDEIHQLDLISRLCGAPTDEIWPGVSELPHFKTFKMNVQKRRIRETFAQ